MHRAAASQALWKAPADVTNCRYIGTLLARLGMGCLFF